MNWWVSSVTGTGVLGSWVCVVDLSGVDFSLCSFLSSFSDVWSRVGFVGLDFLLCFSFSPLFCVLGVGVSCFLGDGFFGGDFGGVFVVPLFGDFSGVEDS